MKDTRRGRIWTFLGVVALSLTAGVASNRGLARRAARVPDPALVAGEELRDAVAAPIAPATAGLAGRPVPTSWFKTPEQRRVEIDTALMSSRRRRANRVAVQ